MDSRGRVDLDNTTTRRHSRLGFWDVQLRGTMFVLGGFEEGTIGLRELPSRVSSNRVLSSAAVSSHMEVPKATSERHSACFVTSHNITISFEFWWENLLLEPHWKLKSRQGRNDTSNLIGYHHRGQTSGLRDDDISIYLHLIARPRLRLSSLNSFIWISGC